MAFVYSLVGASAALSATKPITDESLRMDALRAVFPKTTISLVAGRPIDDSWSPAGHSKEFLFPDALAIEKVYRIVGPASGPAEHCAASDVTNDSSFSKIREVRFEVFRWPGAVDSSSLLAVFQYKFRGAGPPLSCPSIARLARVTNTRGKWLESAGFDLDTTHHTSIQRIELTSLAGHHSQELLIESDWGGAGVAGTNLAVFSLSGGKFNQWLNVPSRVYSSAGEIALCKLWIFQASYNRMLNAFASEESYSLRMVYGYRSQSKPILAIRGSRVGRLKLGFTRPSR